VYISFQHETYSKKKVKEQSLIEFYNDIWDNREHKCFVTGDNLDYVAGTDFYRNVFAHILPKSKYKEYRLLSENVAILAPPIHLRYDNAVLEKILEFEQETGHSFLKLFQKEHDLFQEYKQKYGTRNTLRKITQKYLEYKL